MGFEDRKTPLNIYAPEVARIKKCLTFCYSMSSFKVNAHNVPVRGKIINNLLETDRFNIVSMPVSHNVPAVSYALVEKEKRKINLKKAVSLGLPEQSEIYKELKEKGQVSLKGKKITLEDISDTKKGKKIVYSGDTEICDNLKKMVRDADLLIQDCTYFIDEGLKKPYKHSSLPEVIEMVKTENVKRTILTHISRKYADPEELKNIVKDHPGFEVAEDFMKVAV